MRQRLITVALAALCVLPASPSLADEGMWLPGQIPELSPTLKAMGMRLEPREIWDPTTDTGLASATPWLGGCSSSFVSPEGLIITNHHCAFSALQVNSTPEHDYITNGFLAAKRSDELPYPAGRVTVLKGYEDVTKAVTSSLGPGMGPLARARAIELREKELVAACEKDGLRCRVAEMYGGGSYYLFRQLELRDVRLVYAPVRSIGEYGGEVDNWVWPRHTGDYSFLRAYVGPDGKPADYSPDNVPYRPDRWLSLAKEPLKDGDFTFILGYPGRTMRYRIAASVAEDTGLYYPERIGLLKDLIAILEQASRRDRATEIKLASQLKGLYNSVKNNEGMLQGLIGSDLAGRKRTEEARLTAWIDADPVREAKYGAVLPAMEKALAARSATRQRDFLLGWLPIPRSSSLLSAAVMIERWSYEREKPDLERKIGYQARDERALRQRLASMQRNLDLPSERQVLAYLLDRAARLPADQRITAVDGALAATGETGAAAISALLDRLYAGTRLADETARLAMFGMDHKALMAAGDPMIAFAAALRTDAEAEELVSDEFDGRMVALVPVHIDALADWRHAPLYPDANSTLRFTYGSVKGYSPRDAVFYLPFTTLRGVIEKNTGAFPFNCPPSLLGAATLGVGRFGPYVDPILHDVPVDFLTTNDITGGNSGSPVMNGKGELVGLAFDGNYEAIDSDFQFNPPLSRTIAVDIRYVLWCMDFVDKAHTLMREMGVEPHNR
jgi:hypothetical protein